MLEFEFKTLNFFTLKIWISNHCINWQKKHIKSLDHTYQFDVEFRPNPFLLLYTPN